MSTLRLLRRTIFFGAFLVLLLAGFFADAFFKDAFFFATFFFAVFVNGFPLREAFLGLVCFFLVFFLAAIAAV